MTSYYTGSLTAVPTVNRQSYLDHVHAVWLLFRKHGALRMVEAWGVDIPRGKVNDLHGAVNTRDGETVVFSWIEWTDKAGADAAWQKISADPAMAEIPPMPFDGSRTIFGGFESIVSLGTDRGAGYLQGFALAVPEQNRQAYADLANPIWHDVFRPNGCLGMVEAWGVDVPHGKQTDFHRATLIEDGEVPVFSWTAWPDKASYDAAAGAMEAAMAGQPYPEMPFDGMRMMWGGFEVIFDSDTA